MRLQCAVYWSQIQYKNRLSHSSGNSLIKMENFLEMEGRLVYFFYIMLPHEKQNNISDTLH